MFSHGSAEVHVVWIYEFKIFFVTISTLTLFSYLRFYESIQTVGTFQAQLFMHHMRKCICFR